MNEVTLILGNGFDLNLGLRTTYRQFAESDFWTIGNEIFQSGLAKTLDYAKSKDCNWFDLERILAEYAMPKQEVIWGLSSMIQNDKQCFDNLQDSLGRYIAYAEEQEIQNNSLAAQLLGIITRQYPIDNIFSYNYTNLNTFTKRLNLPHLPYKHVHGQCSDGSQILGISDEIQIRDRYDFLYKTCSPHYLSSNVRYALQRSSFVLFFGHSLGPQDYHYFAQFFKAQSRQDIREQDKKTIFIITYNEESRMDILKQLRCMNDGKVNLLYDCNDLRLFMTDVTSQEEIIETIVEKLDKIYECREKGKITLNE